MITKQQEQLEGFSLVLDRIKAQVLNDPDTFLKPYFTKFEAMLDDLGSLDFFGTEGQNDPRGDMREDIYNMWSVGG